MTKEKYTIERGGKMKKYFKDLFKLDLSQTIVRLKVLLYSGIAVLFLLFFIQLAKDSLDQNLPIQKPPFLLVQILGKPNVQITKYPLQVWRINDEKLLKNVLNAVDNGILNKGTSVNTIGIGSYVFFYSSENKKLGYVSSQGQVESSYVIKPIR